jgi:hypothetical protein
LANHGKFSEKCKLTVLAANVLLAMPVTACSAERNWSKFGLLFVANLNALGLSAAQSLVFVQQNDEVARASRKRARAADDATDTLWGSLLHYQGCLSLPKGFCAGMDSERMKSVKVYENVPVGCSKLANTAQLYWNTAASY